MRMGEKRERIRERKRKEPPRNEQENIYDTRPIKEK